MSELRTILRSRGRIVSLVTLLTVALGGFTSAATGSPPIVPGPNTSTIVFVRSAI
jgi:hypothetical protein